MIRDSARQKAGQMHTSRTPPCSIRTVLATRWPFFFFQNGEKIRNSRVLAYHGGNPSHPVFYAPPPPPLGLLQRKRNACPKYIYGVLVHVHTSRHVAGGCNTANRVGLQEGLSRNKQPRRGPTLFFLTVLHVVCVLNSADFSAAS